MMVCCRMAVKRIRMSEVSVRKRALTTNMETVPLICKGIQNMTFFVYLSV